jgi:hypothetical protein
MRRSLSLVAATMLVCVAAAGPARAAPSKFDIAIEDPLEFNEQDPGGAYPALSANGVRYVRLPLAWVHIAPGRPAHPDDPNDPAYNWEVVDSRLRPVLNQGLVPIFVLYTVPGWAHRGGQKVRVSAYAAFAKALARRYSGADHPRVKYYEQWNEPNFSAFLRETPQGYRTLINAGYSAIHAVHRDNVVIAGGLAPFSNSESIAPFKYMRALLCMAGRKRPKPSCKTRASFDVWSAHPYTSGGPNHSASNPDDAALGDMPEMRRLLRAAQQAGHIKAAGKVGLWVTEFGWDTKGPDPGGVPLRRHARWVAEAMYRMWQSDVSLMTWFQLRDVRPAADNWGGTFQQGIFFNTTTFYRNERIKPVAQVLRFPFVALPQGKRVSVWGRTPGAEAGRVTIELRKGSKWARLKTARTNRYGLFRLRLAGRNKGATLRARFGSGTSYPFKAMKTRDIRVNPFGGGKTSNGGGADSGNNPPPSGGGDNPPPQGSGGGDPPPPDCSPLPICPP